MKKNFIKKIFIILFFEKKFYKKNFRSRKNFSDSKIFLKNIFVHEKKNLFFFSTTDIDLRSIRIPNHNGTPPFLSPLTSRTSRESFVEDTPRQSDTQKEIQNDCSGL